MEKQTIAAKRTGDFTLLENKMRGSSYKMVTTNFAIDKKVAEMTITEQYKSTIDKNARSAKMVNWRFITGDPLVDAQMKVNTDFSAYGLIDIEIDINDIIFDAENFFEDLKEKEKIAEAEAVKVERAKAYDNSFFLTTLKPALEEKGHTVTCDTTKEEYVESTWCPEITLLVDGYIKVDHNYRGQVRADNGKRNNERVTKETKASKISKLIEMIEWVISSDKAAMERLQKDKKAKKSFKDKLEMLIGEEVIEKSQWHNTVSCGRNAHRAGYTTTYYQIKDTNKLASCLTFSESSFWNGKEHVNTISIGNLPSFHEGNAEKLKRIIDIINE